MPITIQRDNSTVILSMIAAFKLLPKECDVFDLSTELGWGKTVPVTLSDGTRALFTITSENNVQPDLDINWPLQSTPPSEVSRLHRSFNVHCKVLLGFDVAVQCTAVDETHAESLIRSVFLGERTAPADFRTVYNREEARDFMLRLKGILDDGDLVGAGIYDVLPSKISETPTNFLTYQGDRS